MKKTILTIYYILWIPLRAISSFMSIVLAVGFLALSLVYAISFEFILDQDIFKAKISDIMKIQDWKPHDNTIILDKNGDTISEQFNEYHVYLPFNKIPKKMLDAIIAIEDRKFWDHKGIDVYSILRAAKTHLNPSHKGYKQGASTITQQVVKNLLLTNEKTITRKIREIVLSLYIESVISKEKILEIYCNTMFLGQGSYGVGAAAKRFFNKNLNELDVHEVSLIAGLFQSPGKFNPARHPERAKERQLSVLASMFEAGFIKQDQLKMWSEKKIEYTKYESIHGKVAPYFVDYVIEESEKILDELDIDLKDSGLKIYTTLDQTIDKYSQSILKDSTKVFRKMEKSIIWDNKLENSEAQNVEGAFLVLDRRTGKILSMTGGRDYEISQFNRTIHSLRPPGSVFKAVTYALGLERGKTWNKQYYISPITIGNYRPRTQQSKLFTETTLLQAFYQSINSPAVLLGNELGVKNVLKFGQRLGIETPLKDEAATLLGSSEVTMMDMARVYQTFANDGVSISPVAIEKIQTRAGKLIYQAKNLQERSKRVISQSTSKLIAEGLKSVIQYGTGYKIRHLKGRAAGKTGTSNKSKDNWFCGFTDDLVVITWLGNDDQNSFRGNISASNTAAPIWGKLVSKSMNYLNTSHFKRTSLLEFAKIHPRYGHRDSMGVGMYFLRGTVPRQEESDLMALETGEQLRVGMNDF
ncbi:MAG: penicillin-binding protein 1A [Bacteriovoracaceae bacterium]|jgi:penicillin-binding protein 1A